ncbi:hypothetical protein ABH973_000686 [Bradyrhizobium ottawaense]
MSRDNVIQLIQSGIFDDQLTEVLRNGARALLAMAVEAEVADFLGQHADLKAQDGHQRVVRHGHLPEREVIPVSSGRRPPAACTRSRGRRCRSWPHPVLAVDPAALHAPLEVDRDAVANPLSGGDFDWLTSPRRWRRCLARMTAGLSASAIGRLKDGWIDEHAAWQNDLAPGA